MSRALLLSHAQEDHPLRNCNRISYTSCIPQSSKQEPNTKGIGASEIHQTTTPPEELKARYKNTAKALAPVSCNTLNRHSVGFA